MIVSSERIAESGMYAMSCSALQPDSKRLVIVQSRTEQGRWVICGARFHVDTWFGDTTGEKLDLSADALWMEAPYYVE